MITKFSIYESIRDKMTPISDERLIKHLPFGLFDIYDGARKRGWDVKPMFNPYSPKDTPFLVIVFNNFKVAIFKPKYTSNDLLFADFMSIQPPGCVHSPSGDIVDFSDLERKIMKLQTDLDNINEGIRDKMTPKSREEIRRDTEDMTPHNKLIYGVDENLPWLVLDAIRDGVDIHYSNDRALQNSIEHGHPEITKILIDNGADVHSRDDLFFIRATALGETEIVRLLIDAGCDPHMNNDQPLKLAKRYGYTDIVTLLTDPTLVESIKDKMTPKSKEDIEDIFKERNFDFRETLVRSTYRGDDEETEEILFMMDSVYHSTEYGSREVKERIEKDYAEGLSVAIEDGCYSMVETYLTHDINGVTKEHFYKAMMYGSEDRYGFGEPTYGISQLLYLDPRINGQFIQRERDHYEKIFKEEIG